MKALPTPTGPWRVGTVAYELVDASRPSHLLSRESGRRIFVKCWYPADVPASSAQHRERLWQQLRTEPNVPPLVRLLLRSAMRIATNAHHAAPYAADAGPPRVSIYNHGLISFASENSMLMEHLASHGHVVIGLQHRSQLDELRALQAAQRAEERKEQAQLERRIKAAPAEERPALWKAYFRIASNTNRIVAGRADDVAFAVANLDAVLQSIPGVGDPAVTELLGVIGLSLGGAVATEYAKRDGNRAGCVVNMDGGIYGTRLDEAVRRPYLMLYSEENGGTNDPCLAAADGAEIVRSTIPGTKHLNFHDISAVYPRVLKWLNAVGSAEPGMVIAERNRAIAEFLSEARERGS